MNIEDDDLNEQIDAFDEVHQKMFKKADGLTLWFGFVMFVLMMIVLYFIKS